MHIIYAVTTCSDKVYKQLFENVTQKPAFQAQKYHRLLIEGLATHTKVDVVANLPTCREAMVEPVLNIPEETEGGARYHYIPLVRNSLARLIRVAGGVFFQTLRLAEKNSAVIVDCLNRTTALAAMLAARLRGCRCVGIITDLPDMLSGGGFSKAVANFVIRCCTDYILLTDKMNEYIRNPGKPYVILEGHSDVTMRELKPSLEMKKKPRVCLYAGGIKRLYGVDLLTEGFKLADLPDVELHIYGIGEYLQEYKKAAAEHPRIYYGGMLLSGEVVAKEMEATILVNPRPSHEEYVKYSFPSKTMEYMACGTPVLMTKLSGMPADYYPHVFLIEEETPEGVAKALEQVFSYSDEDLFEKGTKARSFILDTRNNVIQAKKILDMLEKN